MNANALFQELWVLDPRSKPELVKTPIARRPNTLNNKILGVLDNGKPNAETILDLTAALIAKKYKLAGVVKLRKLDATKGAPQEMLDEMAEKCNIAIVGVGD